MRSKPLSDRSVVAKRCSPVLTATGFGDMRLQSVLFPSGDSKLPPPDWQQSSQPPVVSAVDWNRVRLLRTAQEGPDSSIAIAATTNANDGSAHTATRLAITPFLP